MFPEKTIAANRTKYRQHLFFFIKNGGFDFIYENRLENAGEAYSETISQAPTACPFTAVSSANLVVPS